MLSWKAEICMWLYLEVFLMSDNKTPVIYRNLTYLADVYGTGFWRHI